MSGCGLKNSGCTSLGDNDISSNETGSIVVNNENNDGVLRRFVFVDGDTGRWSAAINYSDEIVCPVGGIVVFYYPEYWHDIVALPTEEAYEACNVNEFVSLSPFSLPGSSFPHVSYYYNCTEPNATAYLTCSVPQHCSMGQKIKIRTSATDFALNTTTNEWIIHVESIHRLLRLLNYREEQGFFVMDHGYQTEELADATLELIWCAMDHCPQAAHDFSPNASLDDCESMVYTLMGFVSRKRPIPQWDRAKDYYQKAIERKGINECAARSYLSQLYWSRGPEYFEAAQIETVALCSRCATSEPLLVDQAKQEFDRQSALVVERHPWPIEECLPSNSTLDAPTPKNASGHLYSRMSWILLALLWKALK